MLIISKYWGQVLLRIKGRICTCKNSKNILTLGGLIIGGRLKSENSIEHFSLIIIKVKLNFNYNYFIDNLLRFQNIYTFIGKKWTQNELFSKNVTCIYL